MELILKDSSQNSSLESIQTEVKLTQNPQDINPGSAKEFLKANSMPITLESLKQECIVPVFSKDNEVTISHNQFIDVGINATKEALGLTIQKPQIRVSHEIKGRTPDAINLPANALKNSQKTLYYERMAWVIRIPEIKAVIGGNEVSLAIGGVRAYNRENLNSKKGPERFSVFIGFQNLVCLNLCISTDGLKAEIKSDNLQDLSKKLVDMIQNFDHQNELASLNELESYFLSEVQFATLIGKLRLYNHLPEEIKKSIPDILMTDNQFNHIAKDYYNSDSFCRNERGYISLWRLYNLLTSANKSSYIDKFLERNENALELANGIKDALNFKNNYSWFIN